GIARSEAHYSALALLFGHWTRAVLYLHQLVRDLRLPDRRRHASQGREGLGQFLPLADRAERRTMGGRANEPSDPDELLRLRHGLSQYGGPLCLFARPRRRV